MFGIKKQMESLEKAVRSVIGIKEWENRTLKQELHHIRRALEKQRRRNSELRHEIRRMRSTLKSHDLLDLQRSSTKSGT